jgi:hypothetical protein
MADEKQKLVQITPTAGVERWALGWVGGKETGNAPKSCFNCPFFYIGQKRCQIHGPDIVIDKVTKDGQQYTPVCIYQTGGTPLVVEDDRVVYNATILGPEKAELSALEWAKGSGTNCGGFAGGAPCEHFKPTDGKGVDGICELMAKGKLAEFYPKLAKAQEAKGHPSPEAREVDWDDCCDGHEGAHISWQEAQELLKDNKKAEDLKNKMLSALGEDKESSKKEEGHDVS